MGDDMTADNVLELLLREQPKFHGATAGTVNWALGTDVLQWLDANIQQDWATLETGCGYSTIVFGARAKSHTAVAPRSAEHDLIKAWLESHGIANGHIRFEAMGSQRALPRLIDDGELNCVLIDGMHGFPMPFIDWYYTANRLAVGGAMIVDDTQLRPCAMLRDFLASESGRWERLLDLERSTIFRRITAEPVSEGVSWRDQPSAHPTVVDRVQRKLTRYKRRLMA